MTPWENTEKGRKVAEDLWFLMKDRLNLPENKIEDLIIKYYDVIGDLVLVQDLDAEEIVEKLRAYKEFSYLDRAEEEEEMERTLDRNIHEETFEDWVIGVANSLVDDFGYDPDETKEILISKEAMNVLTALNRAGHGVSSAAAEMAQRMVED
jgi:hypothetical protein